MLQNVTLYCRKVRLVTVLATVLGVAATRVAHAAPVTCLPPVNWASVDVSTMAVLRLSSKADLVYDLDLRTLELKRSEPLDCGLVETPAGSKRGATWCEFARSNVCGSLGKRALRAGASYQALSFSEDRRYIVIGGTTVWDVKRDQRVHHGTLPPHGFIGNSLIVGDATTTQLGRIDNAGRLRIVANGLKPIARSFAISKDVAMVARYTEPTHQVFRMTEDGKESALGIASADNHGLIIDGKVVVASRNADGLTIMEYDATLANPRVLHRLPYCQASTQQTVSNAAVERQVRQQYMIDIKQCFQQARTEDGHGELSLTVGPNGHSLDVGASGFAPEFVACIIERARTWAFAGATQGRVVIPLTLVH